ncbi:hypothetical protein [Streptomyces bobili]|uniref:hypothetical protein n=1 Tax=Streptomyces bobili TaxID=67280 RepID=UPI003F4CAE5E
MVTDGRGAGPDDPCSTARWGFVRAGPEIIDVHGGRPLSASRPADSAEIDIGEVCGTQIGVGEVGEDGVHRVGRDYGRFAAQRHADGPADLVGANLDDVLKTDAEVHGAGEIAGAGTGTIEDEGESVIVPTIEGVLVSEVAGEVTGDAVSADPAFMVEG